MVMIFEAFETVFTVEGVDVMRADVKVLELRGEIRFEYSNDLFSYELVPCAEGFKLVAVHLSAELVTMLFTPFAPNGLM